MSSSSLFITKYSQTFCLPQEWSLPDSIIYYITKNPSSAKAHHKSIQTCKYFFVKNSIIVADSLHICHYNEGDVIWLENEKEHFQLANVSKKKLWITSEFANFAQTPQNIVSSVLPSIYRSEAKSLRLINQVLSFKQFLFITSKVESIFVGDITVTNPNGSIAPLEKLVEALPTVTDFQM
uniref:AraC family transcriptional regulator n=1 Tax=Panagrolaimus sp. ES5 TaxID=591445 RepID=A0AC34GC47_9BILA